MPLAPTPTDDTGLTQAEFKERLGAVSAGEKSEIPAVRDQVIATESFRANTDRLVKATHKYEKNLRAYSVAGAELGDAAYDYRIEASTSLGQPMLSNCLEKVSEYQRQLDYKWKGMSEKLESEVQVYLKFLLAEEFKDAKDFIASYDNARVAYDASVAEAADLALKKAKPSKVKSADETAAKMKVAFEDEGKLTLEQLSEISSIAECEVIERLCDYVDLTRDYFQTTQRYINEILPFMYKARAAAAEKRHERTVNVELHAKKMSEEAEAAAADAAKQAKKKQVFAVPLQELIERDETEVPILLIVCMEFLQNTTADIEGLFRVPASTNDLNVRQKEIDATGVVDIADVLDAHLVTGLIRKFFRDLPEPLIPYSTYSTFIETNLYKGEEQVEKLKAAVDALPAINRRVLHCLVSFLQWIIEKTTATKMAAASLSTCIAPTIFKPKEMDPATFDPFERNMVIEHIIANFPKIFGELYVLPALPSPPTPSPSAAASAATADAVETSSPPARSPSSNKIPHKVSFKSPSRPTLKDGGSLSPREHSEVERRPVPERPNRSRAVSAAPAVNKGKVQPKANTLRNAKVDNEDISPKRRRLSDPSDVKTDNINSQPPPLEGEAKQFSFTFRFDALKPN